MKTIRFAIWGSVALLLIFLMAEIVFLHAETKMVVLPDGRTMNCTITDSMVVCS